MNHFTHATRELQVALRACWRIWKLSSIAKKRGAISLKRQAVARVKNGMHAWVAFVLRLRLNPERFVRADAHWNRKCQKSYFGAWAWLVKQWRMPPQEEKLLTTKATRHCNKMTLRYHFIVWKDWLKIYARPKKKKFAVVQAHINKMIMKQAVSVWRCMMHVKWVRRMKYDEAIILSKHWCLKRGITRSVTVAYFLLFPWSMFESAPTWGWFDVRGWYLEGWAVTHWKAF